MRVGAGGVSRGGARQGARGKGKGVGDGDGKEAARTTPVEHLSNTQSVQAKVPPGPLKTQPPKPSHTSSLVPASPSSHATEAGAWATMQPSPFGVDESSHGVGMQS